MLSTTEKRELRGRICVGVEFLVFMLNVMLTYSFWFLAMTLDPSVVMVRTVPRSDKDGKMWTDNIELAEG